MEEKTPSWKSDRSARVMRDSVLAPFRSLNFLSDEAVVPVIYSLVGLCVDREYKYRLSLKINLKYGAAEWVVYRNVIDIRRLQSALNADDFEHNIGFHLMDENACEKVERLLRALLTSSGSASCPEALLFFAISRYSFFGHRMYEDVFNVKVEDRRARRTLYSILCCGTRTTKTYVALKKECMILIDDVATQEITFVFMYDNHTRVAYHEGVVKNSVMLTNHRKKITMESIHAHRTRALYEAIQLSLDHSSYGIENRYGSFSPIRQNTPIKHLIDARAYYADLYASLKSAKREIYIAGWWVFPRLFLKRKVKDGRLVKKYRLDCVLKRKAQEGVKVYIMIYKEFEMALTINSMFTVEKLSVLHKNIQIVRHPTFLSEGFVYWTHHEKVVVVDQQVGYVGGIDICLGRYDDHDHNLFESANPHAERKQAKKQRQTRAKDKMSLMGAAAVNGRDPEVWPGGDFSNPLKKDFADVDQVDKNSIDREKTPRMPWHDVCCKVGGYAAIDLSRHFIERWNYVKVISDDPKTNFLLPTDEPCTDQDFGWTSRTQVLRSIGQWSNRYITEKSICLAYEDLIVNSKNFVYIENQFFITNSTGAGSMPENQVGMWIAERIKRAHERRQKFKVYVVIPQLPAFEAEFNSSHSTMQKMLDLQSRSIAKGEKSLFRVLESAGISPTDYIVFLSLRKGSASPGRVVSELIYVHSKVIVADLSRCIIGSANINDRSMCGDRDSEVGILVEDASEGGFAQSLLKSLLVEHLGINSVGVTIPSAFTTEKQVDDLLQESFRGGGWRDLGGDTMFSAVRLRAEINTKICKQLYRTIPDSEIRSKKDLRAFARVKGLAELDVGSAAIEACLDRARGCLVIHPVYFLCDEGASGGALNPENLVPDIIYY